LGKRHARTLLEKACEIAVSYGSYRLRTIRALLKREAPKQEQFAFMEEHAIIRDMGAYSQFVRQALQRDVSHPEGRS
jgi:hypothetical protein